MVSEKLGRLRCWGAVALAIVIGIAFGVSEALLWVFGLISAIRFIIPYAAADAMLILALVTIIALASGCSRMKCGCDCLRGYLVTALIAASVFLIFVQIFVGTTLTFVAKVVLSFVGSTSFWVMLVSFIAAVLCLLTRRRPLPCDKPCEDPCDKPCKEPCEKPCKEPREKPCEDPRVKPIDSPYK